MQFLWVAIYDILATYTGHTPLALFLKEYFRGHPKLGSRDRRAVSQAVHAWYRVGKALVENVERSQEERILAAMCLCGDVPKALLDADHSHWEMHSCTPSGAIRLLSESGFKIHSENIFPHDLEFSAGINKGEWITSLLTQPRLFLRMRGGTAESAKAALAAAGEADVQQPAPDCLSLPNGTNVKDILPDHTYVVQDFSSQRTGEALRPAPHESWWDVCAGAGGKSILLKDLEQRVSLFATDIRPVILHNLIARFRRYKLSSPEVHVLDATDATKAARIVGSRRFDAILCDVPCTGSGTWARTPEGAYFFDPATLAHYTARQTAILSNATNFLKPGGRLVYASCSVFSAENEGVVESVRVEKRLRVESTTLLSGVGYEADSLFVAVLRAR